MMYIKLARNSEIYLILPPLSCWNGLKACHHTWLTYFLVKFSHCFMYVSVLLTCCMCVYGTLRVQKRYHGGVEKWPSS